MDARLTLCRNLNNILFESCRRKGFICGQNVGRMKAEPGGTDSDGFKRAETAMRVLIKIFLVLDFALACFVAVKTFHV
jgi:hypothetical protein